MEKAIELTEDIIDNSVAIKYMGKRLLKEFSKEPDVDVKPAARASKAKKTSDRKIVYEEPKKESKKESKKQEEDKVELNPNKRLSMLSLEEFLELVPYYKDLMKVIDYKGPKWWTEELEFNVCPNYGINGYGQFINTTVKDFIAARDRVEQASQKEESKKEEAVKEESKKQEDLSDIFESDSSDEKPKKKKKKSTKQKQKQELKRKLIKDITLDEFCELYPNYKSFVTGPDHESYKNYLKSFCKDYCGKRILYNTITVKELLQAERDSKDPETQRGKEQQAKTDESTKKLLSRLKNEIKTKKITSKLERMRKN